ncbi:MAG: hypothetical protein PF549_04405 [Patescibacteria group bacterium]|jgi:hypothetical protein|nr:hypothetical protein [Patescibacteria group bacterium]
MNFASIVPLISACLSIIIGLAVFLKGQRNRINVSFAFFAFLISIWMFGTFMMFINKGVVDKIVFWDRFIYIGVVYIPVVMLHFGFALTGIRSRKALVFGYVLSTIFLIFIPTNFFLKDAFVYEWGAHTKAGFLHHVFLFYFFVYIVAWFVIVYRYFRKLKSPFEKAKIKYSFVAFFILAILGPLGYLPAYGISIYPFSYIAGVMFVVIIAYAIIRHRLMDIKLVLRKSTVFVFSLIAILIPAIVLKYFFDKYLGSISAWLDFIILVVGIVGYPFAKKYFFKIANKHFFSSLYDSQKVIAEVSDKLRMIMDISKVYDFIYSVLSNTFHTKTFAVISYDKEKKEYMVQYNKGLKVKKGSVFEGNDFLHRYFTEQNKAIVTEEGKNLYYNKKTKKTIDLLMKLNVELLAPLNVKNKTIGLLV